MAEVLAQFADPLTTTDGSRYLAQACGAPNEQGRWDGWIEFVPINGGPPLRSSRETTQPNKGDATYWATGLTQVYLEGALDRALNGAHAGKHDRAARDAGRRPRSILRL